MAGEIKKRSEIDEQFQWCLEDMYETDELWEEEYRKLVSLADAMKDLDGNLGKDSKNLLRYFEQYDEMTYYVNRLVVYANERFHQDTTVAKYQAMAAKADNALMIFSSATAFASPEILKIPEDVLKGFLENEPKLAAYERALSEQLRKKEHVLSAAEEALLANANELKSAPSNIFEMFNNADIKFPSIRDVEGNRLAVTHGTFGQLLENSERSVRKAAYESLYGSFKQWGNTLATTYTSHLRGEKYFAKSRRYHSTRAMHLDDGNIPESVYDQLIETVHRNLPKMHEYVSLRKRILDVEELHTYDLYVPIVENSEKRYTFEEAKELVLKAVEPMGEEYVKIMREGFENRWIDVYENTNKRSGAYSWAAYGTHPYVLLNFNGTLDSVFTLAHEMGHAIHSYYSNRTQPITYSDYLIFVAEVASTCNENLLMQYLLMTTADVKERRYLINHYLEGFRATVFRQCLFAEFEKIVHEKIWNDEALTLTELNEIYGQLIEQYYGPDLTIDDETRHEWMRIPHFYTSFYVYQYATGYSAATAFAKLILEGGQEAATRYIHHFLCGGCAKDPIELLKAAGVDLSTPQPVESALKVFGDYLQLFKKELK